MSGVQFGSDIVDWQSWRVRALPSGAAAALENMQEYKTKYIDRNERVYVVGRV